MPCCAQVTQQLGLPCIPGHCSLPVALPMPAGSCTPVCPQHWAKAIVVTQRVPPEFALAREPCQPVLGWLPAQLLGELLAELLPRLLCLQAVQR